MLSPFDELSCKAAVLRHQALQTGLPAHYSRTRTRWRDTLAGLTTAQVRHRCRIKVTCSFTAHEHIESRRGFKFLDRVGAVLLLGTVIHRVRPVDGGLLPNSNTTAISLGALSTAHCPRCACGPAWLVLRPPGPQSATQINYATQENNHSGVRGVAYPCHCTGHHQQAANQLDDSPFLAGGLWRDVSLRCHHHRGRGVVRDGAMPVCHRVTAVQACGCFIADFFTHSGHAIKSILVLPTLGALARSCRLHSVVNKHFGFV